MPHCLISGIWLWKVLLPISHKAAPTLVWAHFLCWDYRSRLQLPLSSLTLLQSIFHSAARAVNVGHVCSAPDPPMAPHFSWSNSQSPGWPKALAGLAISSPPAFVTSDLFYFSFPLLPLLQFSRPPHHFSHLGFLNISPTDILGRIFLCRGRLFPTL